MTSVVNGLLMFGQRRKRMTQAERIALQEHFRTHPQQSVAQVAAVFSIPVSTAANERRKVKAEGVGQAEEGGLSA